jgi:hypothetical protein
MPCVCISLIERRSGYLNSCTCPDGDGTPDFTFISYSIPSAAVVLLLPCNATPFSTTHLSNQSYHTFSNQQLNRVVVFPLILTVPIITSNLYRYAQCSTLTEGRYGHHNNGPILPKAHHDGVVCEQNTCELRNGMRLKQERCLTRPSKW